MACADPESDLRAALVSVGGAPDPILHMLGLHRPAHVWYFCSSESRATADQIHAMLQWKLDRDFIEVARYEELGPCYEALRAALPRLLGKWKIKPEQVLVDYTGGTKTMSAALVLAATELFQQFSYVGGRQREKAGLGVVIGGQERVLYQANPWSALAIREVERARDLWDHTMYEAAGRVLDETATRVASRRRFQALAKLADAMAARHRLDFKGAERLLGPLAGDIPKLYDGSSDFGLSALVRQAKAICDSCDQAAATDNLLQEILDNTLRTARQGRYEDAAARLYRAMEMQGQIWLSEKTDSAFENGRLRKSRLAPAELADWQACQPDERGEVRLSSEQVFQALARLAHPQAQKIVEDIALGTRSRWRAATEKRNTSILAHGSNPIGQHGFQQMKNLAAEFLAFDLEAEANPIPPFDARWCMPGSNADVSARP